MSNAGIRPCRIGMTRSVPAPAHTSALWPAVALQARAAGSGASTPQHLHTCSKMSKFQRNTHMREAGHWKCKPQLAACTPKRPVLPRAHQPEPWVAAGCSSLLLLERGPESDLGEFSAGNCSGSLALSSLYLSGLPAMMTALLALNLWCSTRADFSWLLRKAEHAVPAPQKSMGAQLLTSRAAGPSPLERLLV